MRDDSGNFYSLTSAADRRTGATLIQTPELTGRYW